MPDPRVINAIRRIGQERGEPDRYVLGQIAVGLVESNLEDLSGGDLDSYGFRQQRESIYGRQSLAQQINNLYDEMHQLDRGQPLGELLADVQRPAAKYRGRYAERLQEARQIFGGAVDIGGSGGVGTTGVGSQAENPFPTIAALSTQRQGPYSDLMNRGWDLLGQAWEKKYGGQSTPPVPSLGQLAGGGGALPRPGKISKGLREAFFDPVGGWDAGQSIGAIGGHGTHAHFGGRPGAIARVVRLAQRPRWNLRVGEYAPVDPVDPVHTDESWHYRFGGRGGADISDPDPSSGGSLDDFFRMVLRRAGWR